MWRRNRLPMGPTTIVRPADLPIFQTPNLISLTTLDAGSNPDGPSGLRSNMVVGQPERRDRGDGVVYVAIPKKYSPFTELRSLM
jgi:hypothetical protein